MTVLIALALLMTPAATQLNAVETARAESIMQEIRCVVCAGQSIADSDAALALDMQEYVRARVAAGSNAAEIRASLSERYGDEVLLRPPMDWRTAPLWLAPLFLLIGGLGLFFMASRRRR